MFAPASLFLPFLSRRRHVFEREEPLEIGAHAPQRPFPRDFRPAPQPELSEPHHFFDNPKDRFHRLLAPLVKSLTRLGFQAVRQDLFGAGLRTWRGRLGLGNRSATVR